MLNFTDIDFNAVWQETFGWNAAGDTDNRKFNDQAENGAAKRQSRLPCAYCTKIRLTRQFTVFPTKSAVLAALCDTHYNRNNNAERTRIDRMSIKLIALDMDGTTLCSDHHTISQENLDAMADAAAQGILIVPATGRNCNRLP